MSHEPHARTRIAPQWATLKWATLFFVSLAGSACAQTPAQSPSAQNDTPADASADPDAEIWEDDCWLRGELTTSAPPARHSADLGDMIDSVTLAPLAKAYQILPRPIRIGVHHVLSNLDEPDVAANDLLQGNGGRAARSLFRFAVNTTIGVGGLFDVAAKLGAPHHDNDAATTLAVYGVGPGPRFHAPLIDTDNLREAAGFAIDFVIDPVGWGQFRNADRVYAGQMVMDAVDARADVESESGAAIARAPGAVVAEAGEER